MRKNNSNKSSTINQIQTLITAYFKKKIYGYDSLEDTWHCGQCGADMGSCNPRQFCGKYQCDNMNY